MALTRFSFYAQKAEEALDIIEPIAVPLSLGLHTYGLYSRFIRSEDPVETWHLASLVCVNAYLTLATSRTFCTWLQKATEDYLNEIADGYLLENHLRPNL